MFVRPFHGNAVRGIDYELSRGGRFFCTFCMEESVKNLYKGDEDKYFRLKTIDRVIDEMKYLKERYSLDMVKFHDQDFLDIPEQKSWRNRIFRFLFRNSLIKWISLGFSHGFRLEMLHITRVHILDKISVPSDQFP